MNHPFGEAEYFQAVYELSCKAASDINEHLPLLQRLANDPATTSILELGHRLGVSASAFLASNAQVFHSVDVKNCPSWNKIAYQLARSDTRTQKFEFFQCDSLTWEPPREKYDLIFIDDLHEGRHLLAELQKYAPLAQNKLVLHDTDTFGWEGEHVPGSPEPAMGLRWAIINFLLDNREGQDWRVQAHYPHNNGLTVLENIYGS